MPRRSFISATDINRILAHKRAVENDEHKRQIIAAQGNEGKERPSITYLRKVDFNEETRVARITFIEVTEYRTIERYIQRNHVKYPIYSDWKKKKKEINKTIKLTNIELENLNNNSDANIRLFADDIIGALYNEELFPSWFVKKYLRVVALEKIKELSKEFVDYKKEQESQVAMKKKQIEIDNIRSEELQQLYKKQQKILTRKKARVDRIQNAEYKVVKAIFTFGIYLLFVSDSRLKRCIRSRNKTIEKYNGYIREFNACKENIKSLTAEIEESQKSIIDKRKVIDKKQIAIKLKYKQDFAAVQPLPVIIQNDAGFMPLKKYLGIDYEKIVGCYIIRNKEKDKCYVGQSKDVLKRLKQHFKGTLPNNPIFAEDYYTSNYEDKSDLFEVKIIRCETKDQWDKT